MDRNEILRKLPKTDKLMQLDQVKALTEEYGYQTVLEAVRQAQQLLRGELLKVVEADVKGLENLPVDEKLRKAKDSQAGNFSQYIEKAPKIWKTKEYPGYILEKTEQLLKGKKRQKMQRVINGTGVILHTNLGRAPLGEKLARELVPLMTGYTNLELDLETGKRGSRYDHFSENLCQLTGAQAAIAVNNNAAAVMVMLSALAAGKETIVSRGELVEIGGKFRVPDVCAFSGTTLVETGTTNRTYLADYENSITDQTAAFLKVHKSNYEITGFTREVSVEELADLGARYKIPVLADLGSGCLMELEKYGLGQEPLVQQYLKKGADVVTFSGDKLLGGPQAGILVGKKELIEKISRHPLMRAVRIDKFTAAALEATTEIYLRGKMKTELPIYEMLGRKKEELQKMAETLLAYVNCQNLILEIKKTRTVAGGGTTPGKSLEGVAVRIRCSRISAQELSKRFRDSQIPVLGYIEEDWFYLEMRTIGKDELLPLADAIQEIEKSLR